MGYDACRKDRCAFDELFDEVILIEPLAPVTIRKYKDVMCSVLAYAKKLRLIDDNYAKSEYITLPRKKEREIDCMDDEEARIFFNAVMQEKDIRVRTAMLLFLLTGFRRGEVAGLDMTDIDFDYKCISIDKALTIVPELGATLTRPKTKKSKRTNRVSDFLILALKQYRIWWLSYRAKMGFENDYLFFQQNGERLNPCSFMQWLKKILKKAGLKENYTLHSLRHTFITLHITNGVDITTVSKLAGHALPSITTDIYSHAIKSSEEAAVTIIDKILIGSNSECISEEFHLLPSAQADKQRALENLMLVKSEMERLGFSAIEDYEKYLSA
jgi:integrase